MPITIDEEAVEFKISGFESIEINFEPVDIFYFFWEYESWMEPTPN